MFGVAIEVWEDKSWTDGGELDSVVCEEEVTYVSLSASATTN